MKETIVSPDLLKSEVVDSPMPVPKDDEVLIKVAVSGSNPKDWKYPVWNKNAFNSGDDIAGTVEAVGKSVFEFKPGDRVAAFHEMLAPHGSFAEYAIAHAHTTFLIPDSVSFEEAATIPLAALTAAYGLFETLGLPTPLVPAAAEIPLLVYGGSTSVGVFAIQLAKLAGIGPIIAVAGASKQVALDAGADFVVDYRGNDNVGEEVRAKLKPGQKLLYAWDTVSEKGSHVNIGKAVEPTAESKVSMVLPKKDPEYFDASPINFLPMYVGAAHCDVAARRDFAYVFCRLFSKWLGEGRFKGHKFTVVDGGLAGVGKALTDLRDGKVSGYKCVFRIADTPGV